MLAAIAALALVQQPLLRDVASLPAEFGASRNEVKLVLILSPTSGRGSRLARLMKREVLAQLIGQPIQTFVVWTPILPGDSREQALKATQQIEGIFVNHYWDPIRRTGRDYGVLVELPNKRQLAFDCVFAHGKKSEWLTGPPFPDVWMHELGVDERTFDPEKFRAQVERLAKTELTLTPPGR